MKGKAPDALSELLRPLAIGTSMRPRIRDLTLLLNSEGDLLARAGAAVIAHEALPHPVLHLMEELYPREVARARFTALWSERKASAPDPRVIGRRFKGALTSTLRLEKNVDAHDALLIQERLAPGRSPVRPLRLRAIS